MIRPGSFVSVLAAAFVLFVGLSACGKSPGGKCKLGEATCADKKTALACHGGKLSEVACNGPQGCAKYGEHANCDNSIAMEGDACMGDGEEEYACTPDKRRAVQCKTGKFERYLECRGKGGCTISNRVVSCDTSIAGKGDPCKTQDQVACAEDGKMLLRCREGAFTIYRHCRGQFGCRSAGDIPACDETLSLEGDPCGLAGQVVCSVDGQSELVCQGSSFIRSRGCKRGCTISKSGNRVVECN
jgi:hypothetical protein